MYTGTGYLYHPNVPSLPSAMTLHIAEPQCSTEEIVQMVAPSGEEGECFERDQLGDTYRTGQLYDYTKTCRLLIGISHKSYSHVLRAIGRYRKAYNRVDRTRDSNSYDLVRVKKQCNPANLEHLLNNLTRPPTNYFGGDSMGLQHKYNTRKSKMSESTCRCTVSADISDCRPTVVCNNEATSNDNCNAASTEVDRLSELETVDLVDPMKSSYSEVHKLTSVRSVDLYKHQHKEAREGRKMDDKSEGLDNIPEPCLTETCTVISTVPCLTETCTVISTVPCLTDTCSTEPDEYSFECPQPSDDSCTTTHYRQPDMCRCVGHVLTASETTQETPDSSEAHSIRSTDGTKNPEARMAWTVSNAHTSHNNYNSAACKSQRISECCNTTTVTFPNVSKYSKHSATTPDLGSGVENLDQLKAQELTSPASLTKSTSKSAVTTKPDDKAPWLRHTSGTLPSHGTDGAATGKPTEDLSNADVTRDNSLEPETVAMHMLPLLDCFINMNEILYVKAPEGKRVTLGIQRDSSVAGHKYMASILAGGQSTFLLQAQKQRPSTSLTYYFRTQDQIRAQGTSRKSWPTGVLRRAFHSSKYTLSAFDAVPYASTEEPTGNSDDALPDKNNNSSRQEVRVAGMDFSDGKSENDNKSKKLKICLWPSSRFTDIQQKNIKQEYHTQKDHKGQRQQDSKEVTEPFTRGLLTERPIELVEESQWTVEEEEEELCNSTGEYTVRQSRKNVRLIQRDGPHAYFQCCRHSSTEFIVEYRSPLSALQAFGILVAICEER